jgi:hypothetical protein
MTVAIVGVTVWPVHVTDPAATETVNVRATD